MSFTVKSKFGDDIRRFSVPANATFTQLKGLLAQIYGSLPPNCLLTYNDDENDRVNITSNDELAEAIRIANTNSSKLLYLNINIPQGGINASPLLQSLSDFDVFIQKFADVTIQESSERYQVDKEVFVDVTQELCDQLNSLVIDEIPEKKALFKYNLDTGNSNEPCSDKERRENFKKLFPGPSPYAKVTASGNDPNPPAATPTGAPPAKKKRPVFRKSCPRCSEPMDKVNGQDVCKNLRCKNK